MSGISVASTLIQSARDWAQEQSAVGVSVPFVAEYLKKHPEYSDLCANLFPDGALHFPSEFFNATFTSESQTFDDAVTAGP
jgi:hypothetical protein